MVLVKSKLVCLSFLILTSLVSVLQEICLYSYRFVLFWLKAGNVSFVDTNPCILVTMLFVWEDVSHHGNPFLYIQNTKVCAWTWVNVHFKQNKLSCVIIYDRALPIDASSQFNMTVYM